MRTTPIMTQAAWTIQALLATVFLVAGGSKLILIDPLSWSDWIMRFVGVAQIVAAIGLVGLFATFVLRSGSPADHEGDVPALDEGLGVR